MTTQSQYTRLVSAKEADIITYEYSLLEEYNEGIALACFLTNTGHHTMGAIPHCTPPIDDKCMHSTIE